MSATTPASVVSWRRQTVRGLMILAALGALSFAVRSLGPTGSTPVEVTGVHGGVAELVVALVYLAMGFYPNRVPVAWGLLLVHRFGIVVAGYLLLGSGPGGFNVWVLANFLLLIILGLAYIVSGDGWTRSPSG